MNNEKNKRASGLTVINTSFQGTVWTDDNNGLWTSPNYERSGDCTRRYQFTNEGLICWCQQPECYRTGEIIAAYTYRDLECLAHLFMLFEEVDADRMPPSAIREYLKAAASREEGSNANH